MSDVLILEWSRDRLAALLATTGTRPARKGSATTLSSEHTDTRTPAIQAGETLRHWLAQAGLAADQAVVVVPREAVVVRRLQLPQAPVDELPDLVRFQAATRTSAPIESLVLDFLTLPVLDPEGGQDVISFTIDRAQVDRIRSVCEAARLQLTQIAVSSLTVAELVRVVAAGDLGVGQPDLVIFQHNHRLEVSIFDFGTLVFSHATQLPDAEQGDRLKALKSELNRSLVSLHQSHPDVSIQRCFYVNGAPDAAVQAMLSERFPGQLTCVDAAELFHDQNVAEYESLAGAALPQRDERLRIDFLNPRQRREIPDRRNLYYGLAAVAALLLLGIGLSLFYSRKSALEESIAALQNDVNSQTELLKKGKPREDAYLRLARWKESDAQPIELWNELRSHLPGTDRVYFVEFKIVPTVGETAAKFLGRGRAKSRVDVDGLNQALSDSGFRVRPTTSSEGNRDPDYPWDFELDVELPRPKPPAPAGKSKPPSTAERS